MPPGDDPVALHHQLMTDDLESKKFSITVKTDGILSSTMSC